MKDKQEHREEGNAPEAKDHRSVERIEVMGEKNTFVIQVRCQQNATWQGSVHWVENEQTQHFRSALELIRLMDEALSK